MKFAESWLKSFIDYDLSSKELAERLTRAGLEVDSVESACGDFKGVVVGEIISIEPHPDADKLRVCQVDVGNETVTIVTNAQNVFSGMRLPVARVGAELDGGEFKIKKAKLRGVESFGMFCSEVELGMAEKANGVMNLPSNSKPGVDVCEVLNLPDAVIDVDLTPNRGDCASVLGIARELAALLRKDFQHQTPPKVEAVHQNTVNIVIDAPEACPHYYGRVFENVNMEEALPFSMQETMRRSGVNALDPVVDLTNYCMHELGQPFHAFDLDKLDGDVHVRFAKEGETLVLLDGEEVKLSADTLIIADEKKPLALAGAKGGLASAVTKDTKRILMECAYFTPDTVAGKTREYNIVSDGAYRFERGVNPQMQEMALERISHLLCTLVDADPGPVIKAGRDVEEKAKIFLRLDRVNQLLGFEVSGSEVKEIFSALNMQLKDVADGFEVVPPGYRFDINMEDDLIEEVVRLKGFDNVPVTAPKVEMTLPQAKPLVLSQRAVQDALVGLGFHEIISYSFVSEKLQALIDPDHTPEKLSNPISNDMSVMRTSLLPGLLSTLQHNKKRQQNDVRLFEMGMCFIPKNGDLRQEVKVGGLISGLRQPAQWAADSTPVDFYDLKADVESLLARTQKTISFELCEHHALHPGQSAKVLLDGVEVGVLGALHPTVAKKLKLKNVFVFELDFVNIKTKSMPVYQPLSKFPSMERDLAIVLDKSHGVESVFDVVRKAAGSLLTDLGLFDVYEGEGVPEGSRSLALRFTFQDSEDTLKDEQVEESMDNIIGALNDQLEATVRS